MPSCWMLCAVAAAVAAWLFGVMSYLRMMRTIPPAVARLRMARLRVRANMLCFLAPELFVGAGATWRRRYIVSLFAFGVCVVAATLAAAVGRS